MLTYIHRSTYLEHISENLTQPKLLCRHRDYPDPEEWQRTAEKLETTSSEDEAAQVA